MRHCDCTRCCLYSERVQVFLMIPRWSLPPYSNWLWERLATSNLVRAVGLRHHSMEQHLLDTCSTVLLRSHMSCVQHSDTITYLYYVWCATNRTAPFWVSLGSVALPNRLFDMEFLSAWSNSPLWRTAMQSWFHENLSSIANKFASF